MKYKDFSVEFKDAENGNGKIAGYCSTWIREPDAYNDVVKQGAFADSLKKIEEEGKTIPLIFSHRLDDLNAYLGKVTELHEDDHGLYFEADFDNSSQAQKVREMCMDKRLTKFSFAYDTLDEGTVTLDDGRKANELRKLDIFEVSIVLIPANQDASMTDIKAGKRNSAKDEQTIKDAIKLLQELLGEIVEDDNKDDEVKDESDENKEKSVGDNVAQTEDQKLLNLQKFEMLQLIKKYESKE